MFKKNISRAGFIPYGGLGNQLFQFAAALSLMTDENKFLAIDILGTANNNQDGNPEILDFEIERLVNLQKRKTNQSRVTRKLISTQLQISNKVFQKKSLNVILSKILNIYSIITSLTVGIRVLSPNGLGWDDKLKPSRRDFTLLGNFHSYLYINDRIKSNLKDSLKSRTKSKEIMNFEKLAFLNKPTGIHVRLGDYLLLDELNVVNKEYFAAAVEIIESKNPGTNYWIFTNSRELSESYLPASIISRCDFIPETISSAQTLEIMWLCDNYIISNSTFGWWGAYLSKADNPLVIAPKNWFKTLTEPKYICLPEWIRV
jgi:hypothetical protein